MYIALRVEKGKQEKEAQISWCYGPMTPHYLPHLIWLLVVARMFHRLMYFAVFSPSIFSWSGIIKNTD